jgi:hypothetical protein
LFLRSPEIVNRVIDSAKNKRAGPVQVRRMVSPALLNDFNARPFA